jgi:hypothetical protein
MTNVLVASTAKKRAERKEASGFDPKHELHIHIRYLHAGRPS